MVSGAASPGQLVFRLLPWYGHGEGPEQGVCLATATVGGRVISAGRLDRSQSGQGLGQPGFQPELSLDDYGCVQVSPGFQQASLTTVQFAEAAQYARFGAPRAELAKMSSACSSV